MYNEKKYKPKTMEKIIVSLLLVFSLFLGMVGCGKGQAAGDEQGGMAGYDLEKITGETAHWLISENPHPVYGSTGGEWLVFGISRWGGEVPEDWYDAYYKNVENYVRECGGMLDEKKHTEYSRVIIALTAIGKDPADVAGYNLLEPLADFDKTIFQGINGPAYALLALDVGGYEIPQLKTDGVQATREMYVDYILAQEAEGGGWSLTGGPADADMTAIVLQALAKYRDREDVDAAVDRAVNVLSELQNEEGGYDSFDMESSETLSQVIVALTELGISVDDDRFVKNSNTLLDKLMEFRAEDGSFKHISEGESNQMATEQAFYAMVALYRIEQGQPSIYAGSQ